jgi:molecular chaperone Hsp33
MAENSNAMEKNEIHRFLLQEAPIRGESVRLTTQWQEVVKRHNLPPAVQRALGELTAAAALLSAALKFDGALVLQILGDGPVHLIVVESNSVAASVGELGTKFRATAKLRESIDASTIDPAASFIELVNPFGTARFVMTLDPRIKLPGQQTYQAIVPLEGTSVAEVIAGYMARSEQVPTRLWLAADANQASGLLLQKLPSEGGTIDLQNVDAQKAIADESWRRLEQLADTVGPDELLITDSEQLMHRLFWQEPMRSLDQRTCYFGCSCTREKVSNMLQTLGLPEIEGILSERESVLVNCDYCNTAYEFDAIDCAALFSEALTTLKPPATPQ